MPFQILNQGIKPFCSAYAVAGMANFLLDKVRTDLVDVDKLFNETMNGTDSQGGHTLSQILNNPLGLPLLSGARMKVSSVNRILPYPSEVKYALKSGPLVFTYQISNGAIFEAKPPDYIVKWPLVTHSMVMTDFDENKNLFIYANSYGTSWGENGYGRFEAQYMKAPYLVDCFSFNI